MKTVVLCLMSAAALCFTPAQADTAMLPGNASNGKTLHAANCAGCHDASVYTRKNRKVGTVEGLAGQVNACNKQLSKNFNRDQVNDIVLHLNEAYYKFK
jgi:cytochrome c553